MLTPIFDPGFLDHRYCVRSGRSAYDASGKVRNLPKRGACPTVAIPICPSRKGPWGCARTLAAQSGIANHWFKDQGLVSDKEL